jgi:hypothetical protein
VPVQVTYHTLQVIFQHLHITKGNAFPSADGVKAEATTPVQVPQPDPSAWQCCAPHVVRVHLPANTAAMMVPSRMSSDSHVHRMWRNLQAAGAGFGAAPDGGGGDGLSPIQKAVATVLKDGAATSDGVSLQEVRAIDCMPGLVLQIVSNVDAAGEEPLNQLPWMCRSPTGWAPGMHRQPLQTLPGGCVMKATHTRSTIRTSRAPTADKGYVSGTSSHHFSPDSAALCSLVVLLPSDWWR